MKKLVFAIIVFAAIFTGSAQVAADTFLPPEPFEIWSDDETMVFRFEPLLNEHGSFYRTARTAVYKNDELLYTLGFPAMGVSESNFFLSQNFQHLMFMPATGFEVALQFFTNGVLMQTHYISDLVGDMNQVWHSVTMALWLGRLPDVNSAVEHIIEQDILRIITADRIIYTFDLTTGAILGYEHSLPTVGGEVYGNSNVGHPRGWLLIPAGIMFILVGALVVVKIK